MALEKSNIDYLYIHYTKDQRTVPKDQLYLKLYYLDICLYSWNNQSLHHFISRE